MRRCVAVCCSVSCIVLPYVAAWCSVLQCGAIHEARAFASGGAKESDVKMCCSACCSVWQCVLQCVAVSCYVVPLMRQWSKWCAGVRCAGVLHCVAPCCTVLHRVALCCCTVLHYVALCCYTVLQCFATDEAACCNVLQVLYLVLCVAVYCSVLQCVAVCCSCYI